MSSSVYIAMLGWPLLMAFLSFTFRSRRIALLSLVGGNLFLPVAKISISGFPDYTRSMAAGFGALIVAVVVAAPSLLSCKPRLLDLLFLAFIISPGISSLANGLGAYDAMSAVVSRTLEWGVAYWVGRSLFASTEAMQEVATGFVLGGIAYAPLCMWESIMSPQLHRLIYGFHPSAFSMTFRWGGWRPMVFMQHGLAVGAWMASAAVVAWILWRAKVVRSIIGVPMMPIAIGLLVITISLRSTGAALLVVGMIAAAEFVQFSRMRLALLTLLLMPAGYIGLRVAGWDGEQLVAWSSRFGEDRMGSLNVRLQNDATIVDRAMEKPLFGWGGWGRWRVRDEFGRDITISDSWWGILVGSTGIVGLVSAYGCFIAPMFLLIRRRRPGRIFEGAEGAAWAVGLAILLFVIDTLANAMPNSSFMLAAGAMSSFVLRRKRRERALESASLSGSASSLPMFATTPENRSPSRTIDLR